MRTAALMSCIAIACCAALAGCGVTLPDGVVYPSISPAEGPPIDRSYSFDFEGTPAAVSVRVDGGLYAGAAAATKTVTRFGNARENDWIDDYYPAFIDEEHQEGFYADVLAALRAERQVRGLDADRYAELLAVFVQSLTYQTDPNDLSPKFPVETFVEGAGDCDDKTLLLAGLLAREGYDVAIFLFEAEEHVSCGIRGDGDGYAGTGYEFIETTAPGLIGMVPDSFAGGITLSSRPRVIRVGTGTTPFGAAAQVREILAAREQAIAQAGPLADRVATADAELARLEGEVTAARAALDALRAAGRVQEYNASVDAYNALVSAYNAAAGQRNALAEQYNALTDIDRAVVEGLDDRVGTYARVAGTLD